VQAEARVGVFGEGTLLTATYSHISLLFTNEVAAQPHALAAAAASGGETAAGVEVGGGGGSQPIGTDGGDPPAAATSQPPPSTPGQTLQQGALVPAARITTNPSCWLPKRQRVLLIWQQLPSSFRPS